MSTELFVRVGSQHYLFPTVAQASAAREWLHANDASAEQFRAQYPAVPCVSDGQRSAPADPYRVPGIGH